jgi:DUF971 family protein
MDRAATEPREYRQEPDGALVIDWADGHQTILSPRRLRAGCPCASCREERSATIVGNEEPAPAAGGSIRIVELSPVGRYAIAPVWSDGHRTGIYSWDVLRGLCDCFECALQREAR